MASPADFRGVLLNEAPSLLSDLTVLVHVVEYRTIFPPKKALHLFLIFTLHTLADMLASFAQQQQG